MNKRGVNSGVSRVTETDAGHGMLLGSPVSKMATRKKEIYISVCLLFSIFFFSSPNTHFLYKKPKQWLQPGVS